MATFRGTTGSDRLKGSSFADLFESSAGNDLLDGGSGSDTVSYAGNTGPVNVNLATGSAQKYGLNPAGGAPVLRGTDTLVSIENVVGTRYDDTITGDAGNNIIAGLGGRDTINGGGGTDTIDYSASSSAVNVDLLFNTASGGDANGDRLTSIENVLGTSSADNIYGSDVGNRLEGRDGGDIMRGNGGDDTLIGGLGRDQLNGGTGRDTFLYTTLADSPNVALGGDPVYAQYDYISGFESGVDIIDLSGVDADVGQAGNQQFTIRTAFTGTAGELVIGPIVATPGDGFSYDAMLLGDTNGDSQADFAIELHWQSAPGIGAWDIIL